MVDLDVNYATTLVAALLLGVGFVLQQYSAEQEPESRFLSARLFTDLLRKPRWLAGIGCMVAGYVLAAWSIGHLVLSLVEPMLTTYLVWALILAVPMSRQAVRLADLAGALVLIGGVALLSVSRSAKPVGMSFGSLSHWYAAAIIAGIAFAAVRAGHRRRGPVRATLTGLGAGLVFGIQDALTRQTLQILHGGSVASLFTNWPAYALVGAGILGIWLMQNAFSAAPLRASLPAIAAGEPVAGITLGILVFGDRVQISAGTLALQAAGIAALIIGVVTVARSRAFSGLRGMGDAGPAPEPRGPESPPPAERPPAERPPAERPPAGSPQAEHPPAHPPVGRPGGNGLIGEPAGHRRWLSGRGGGRAGRGGGPGRGWDSTA
jgi:drug/metabolite transporter (DMT)-like permease